MKYITFHTNKVLVFEKSFSRLKCPTKWFVFSFIDVDKLSVSVSCLISGILPMYTYLSILLFVSSSLVSRFIALFAPIEFNSHIKSFTLVYFRKRRCRWCCIFVLIFEFISNEIFYLLNICHIQMMKTDANNLNF